MSEWEATFPPHSKFLLISFSRWSPMYFGLIDSSITLRYSTATWSKQQFKPFNIWFTVFTCIMENSISCYWISLFTQLLFQFLFRDCPNKICVGGGGPLKRTLIWIYGTTNDLPGTNSGLPRNFILRCSKNLNTATKNDKHKKKRQTVTPQQWRL